MIVWNHFANVDITNLQVTNFIKNENEHTHDANFEDLDEERFQREILTQLKKPRITKSKKFTAR